MTKEQLFELLMFDRELESADILYQADAGHGATFIRALLHYPEGDMMVPFVHYEGQYWIFTPFDWQGQLPESVDEIDSIDWRVNNTETEGVIFDGVPMLAPWVPQPVHEDDDARTSVGRMVREAREKAGLTVRELADMAGMGHSHIVRIEAGKYNMTIDSLYKVLNALGLRLTFTPKK